MNMKAILTAARKCVIAVSVTVSVGAYALVSEEEQAAYECASSALSQNGYGGYEVTRLVTRSGNQNFDFWMNAHDASLATFCEVRSGEVARLYTQSEPWKRTNMFRPQAQEQAAR